MNFNHIVILTGAGISAESGIRTFRAADGLWEEHRIEEVATPEAFERNPKLVQKFYNLRRRDLLDGIKPNTAHTALADIENRCKDTGQNFTLITQNIDNLHEQAGSKNLLHMHGELLKIHCRETGSVLPCRNDVDVTDQCPCCSKAGNLRPHIVWFGEMPLYMDVIEQALSDCDLFISIGTSGNVYPAAGFQQLAKSCGAHTVELNLEPSENASSFDQAIYGPATEIVPTFIAQLR